MGRMSLARAVKSFGKEFFRYGISGGISFLVDFFVLLICVEFVFPRGAEWSVYLATVIAFIMGFITNYLLSVFFVFVGGKKNFSSLSFFVFIIIALTGLGLTELGMYAGVSFLDMNYIPVKIIVSGIVLIWNYGGRKAFLVLKGAS